MPCGVHYPNASACSQIYKIYDRFGNPYNAREMKVLFSPVNIALVKEIVIG